MSWKTKFTESFPCTLPILGSPMAGVSGGHLAAETARAGALGFLAGGYLTSLDSLETQIDIFRKHAPPHAPLCIGFISHAALGSPEGWRRFETVLERHHPDMVQFFAPSLVTRSTEEGNKDSREAASNIRVALDHNCKVLVQVGSVHEATEALSAGIHGIIVQGSEAGGHGLRRELGSGTLPLAARIVSLVGAQQADKQVPVLAAGGIVDGRGVAAALALGCDGAVLGTRLWASEEALGHDSFKQRLASLDVGPDEVVRTTVVDQIMNTYLSTPWPEPYDSVGIVQSVTSRQWDGKATELAEALSREDSTIAADYKKATSEGDPMQVGVLSGEGVGDIDMIEPAFNIITRINEEARSIVKKLPNLLVK